MKETFHTPLLCLGWLCGCATPKTDDFLGPSEMALFINGLLCPVRCLATCIIRLNLDFAVLQYFGQGLVGKSCSLF